jgi:5-formyltetrahydrofolate cyclo-ligase
MQSLAAQGARLALPAIASRGQSLRFRVWSANDRLVRGPLGILEPSPAAAEVIPDIVLVPLAAFDRSGHRIGYGAGHYDRTLAHLRKSRHSTAIGLAFAAQQVEAVPALQHDVPLDFVLTETQILDFRSS